MNRWRHVTALAGTTGAVLFLFGALTYGLTRRFDLWTAVHFAGGGVLLAIGAAANLPALRRATGSRAGRHRLRSAIGLLLLVTVVTLAAGQIGRWDARWDTTGERIHSWSEAGAREISALPGPVRVSAFWEPGAPDADEVRELIARANRVGPGFEARLIDPAERPETAAAMAVDRSGTVVVEADDRTARATYEPGEFGEAALLALVRRATSRGPRTIAVGAGLGGPSPSDAASPGGAAYLAEVWTDLAFDHRSVDLADPGIAPTEAAFLALIGPSRALTPEELGSLAAWIDGGGRAFVMAEPGIDPGLAEMLALRGVSLGSDVVVDPDGGPALGARAGVDVLSDVPVDDPASGGASESVLLRVAQSVDAVPDGPGRVVLYSGPDAWAENDLEALVREGRTSRDPGDRPGPVPLAVAVGLDRERMVVVGDVDLVRNARLGSFGNRAWVEAVSRWLAGDPVAVDGSPRRLRASRLDLDAAAFRSLFRLSVVLVPEAILVLGLGVWWWRRGL